MTKPGTSSLNSSISLLRGCSLNTPPPLGAGTITRDSMVSMGHEVLHPPQVINCYTAKTFVSESARLLLTKIKEAVVTEDATGQPHWSGKIAIVGLSGGSTPRPIYEAAAQYMTLNNALWIDFTKVLFFLVDERYVPEDAPESNTRMIKETLMRNAVVPPENFIFPDTSKPIDECVRDYEQRLSELFALSRPTLVTLGIGPDGHLASWFPPLDAEQSFAAYDPFHLVAHTMQDRFPCRDRITVSMHLLLSARSKLFFMQGQEKVDVYRRLTARPPQREEVRAEPLLQVLRSQSVAMVAHPPIDKDALTELHTTWKENQEHLTVIILGASGDLAMKKTFPALFSLYCAGYLPADFHIAAYARTPLSVEMLFNKMKPRLETLNKHFALKNELEESEQLSGFKDHLSCHACPSYHDEGATQAMQKFLAETIEQDFKCANRVIYLALPPNVFAEAVATFRCSCWSKSGWNRVIVEKPFGRDSDSSRALSDALAAQVKENEVYRIDHYLGKEMVLNLLVLRFANAFLEPIWNRHFIKCVRITWKETSGTEGRGGYFDNYGIIRDVIQNHLTQIVSLIAMERPVTLGDEDVRDEKVKVLRSIAPVRLDTTVIGQFVSSEKLGQPGYQDDPSVPKGSKAATFATTVLNIENDRWSGVPFILKAGKALESQITEVRLQMRAVCAPIFGRELPQNELVIRIQPRDAIYLKCVGKQPGLAETLVETELDLSILERLQVDRINDAYERLLLDVIKGDKKNFVRTDELREAWRIFTPLLRQLEEKSIVPEPYEFGGRGPQSAYQLIQKQGFKTDDSYVWRKF